MKLSDQLPMVIKDRVRFKKSVLGFMFLFLLVDDTAIDPEKITFISPFNEIQKGNLGQKCD